MRSVPAADCMLIAACCLLHVGCCVSNLLQLKVCCNRHNVVDDALLVHMQGKESMAHSVADNALFVHLQGEKSKA